MALKNEPTFFEQITMGAKGKENDSDEELEEEEVETTKGTNKSSKEQEIPKQKPKTE